eukprot:TRINITY_DN12611_c0_g1_i1.p2 TRINITY_DN12611_c0_g1~~TRINITY_DN12611_c0_g1_i1.p2  ORF type:complete len:116 (-),score=9.10 TRINITY_DN12611_c0_g1_i1:137-484(-)
MLSFVVSKGQHLVFLSNVNAIIEQSDSKVQRVSSIQNPKSGTSFKLEQSKFTSSCSIISSIKQDGPAIELVPVSKIPLQMNLSQRPILLVPTKIALIGTDQNYSSAALQVFKVSG